MNRSESESLWIYFSRRRPVTLSVILSITLSVILHYSFFYSSHYRSYYLSHYFPLFPIIPHYLPLCQNEQAHRQTDRYERTFPNDLSHTQRAQLDRNKIVTVCSCVTRIVVDFYFRKFLPVYCNTITLTFYKIYT